MKKIIAAFSLAVVASTAASLASAQGATPPAASAAATPTVLTTTTTLAVGPLGTVALTGLVFATVLASGGSNSTTTTN